MLWCDIRGGWWSLVHGVLLCSAGDSASGGDSVQISANPNSAPLVAIVTSARRGRLALAGRPGFIRGWGPPQI